MSETYSKTSKLTLNVLAAVAENPNISLRQIRGNIGLYLEITNLVSRLLFGPENPGGFKRRISRFLG